MRKRNKAVLVRFTDSEYLYLRKQADNAGLKIEQYLRQLVEGTEVKPYPPEAYKGLLRELSAIGNNINQIAHVANTQQNISRQDMSEALRLVNEAMRKIKEVF